MSRKNSLQPHTNVAGRSYLFNAILVVLNLVGLTFLVIGYHENFAEQQVIFKSIGYGVMIATAIGLIILKGRMMISSVARVLVGGLFIVSGLVKANDPIGFAYKLEEYFEDGALAYRIKEWFGMPDFSLEYLIPLALTLSVVICVVEIVLGVLTIFNVKMKWVSSLLVIMMVFFTFLTWHTANCDGSVKFKDRDRYAANDQLGIEKAASAKANEDVKLVSKDTKWIVIDEMKQPQCVDDCGCFGDALKGSVGRSLTPNESMWKDIVLLYLSVWIFVAAFKRNKNEEKSKMKSFVASMLVVLFFSFVFGWYFPVFFAFLSLLSASWIVRSSKKRIPKVWSIAAVISVFCALMVAYVLYFDPIKDYRAYAVGSNLVEKMNDGIEGKFQSLLVYKNTKTGETIEYDASSDVYNQSKIWEKKEWKFLENKQKTIIPVKLPSITAQFNPYLSLNDLSPFEENMSFVKEQIQDAKIKVFAVRNIEGDYESEVSFEEYNMTDYPLDEYEVLDTLIVVDPAFTEISTTDFIVGAKKIVLLVVKNLKEANFAEIEKYKTIFNELQKKGIPMLMLVSSNPDEINKFRKKYKFNIPTFLNDETELKAISRSNPALLVLKSGTVIGKYPHRSTPDFNWLIKNDLK